MKTTTTWVSAAILALAAATALAQDKQGRAPRDADAERASMGGMMGDGGMMGGGMMGRSRPNEQWRAPEGGR